MTLFMKKIFMLVVLMSSLTVQAQEWMPLPMETHIRIDDLYFVDENTGYTAGGWASTILKTTNAGSSWTQVAKFDKYLRAIEFMNADIGLCGSLDGSLYRTIDGGETWTDIASNITPHPEGVCGLAKADENTIYGVGIWSEPAFVIKSIDQGLNWEFIDMSEHAVSLIDAYFFDADHGFVTGSVSEQGGGVILYTEDGGKNWTEKFRTNHMSDRVWKIQSPDGIHFFGSIETFNGNTRFLKSSDAGQTWEMKEVSEDYYYIQTIGFIDPLRGWTGGENTMFETRDGGDTWKKVNIGATYNRFVRIDENTAYVTGKRVYKFTREIVTGTTDPAMHDPVHQMSVTPNPTTGKTNIEVIFGNPTMAHLSVYSTLGKSLDRIFDGHAGPGKQIFSIDLSGHQNQSYIVILKTNEGMISKKFIKY
jgi:photosystem II stability/assembly factor-like uncharacterized protein